MKLSIEDFAFARALSIRQPWAELILRRRKPIEIRRWTRKYRGLLLIHASRGWNAAAAGELGISKKSVTRGAFVGIAWLDDVRPFTKEDAKLLERKRGGSGWWKPRNFAAVSAVKLAFFIFESQETVDRDFGGSWYAAMK